MPITKDLMRVICWVGELLILLMAMKSIKPGCLIWRMALLLFYQLPCAIPVFGGRILAQRLDALNQDQ